MFGQRTTLLLAEPLREVNAIADRPGCFEITGRNPLFELQAGAQTLPQGWVSLSFHLGVEGVPASPCVLSVETGLVTQRIVLANAGRMSAVAHLPADVLALRLEVPAAAGVVTLGPVAIRPISKPEAAGRLVMTFLVTRVGNLQEAKVAARTMLRLLRSGGPAAVARRVAERLLYSRPNDASAPLVPPVEHLTDAQRYDRWIAKNENRTPTAPPVAGPSDTVGVLILAGGRGAGAVSLTLDSLKAQTAAGWRAVIALAEDDPAGEGMRALIGQDGRFCCAPLSTAWDQLVGGDDAVGYVTVIDAGDRLARHALAECLRTFHDWPSVDIVYSDEDVMDERGRRSQPFFKPEWSPELLAAFNYFGRLTLLRRRLAVDVGGLAAELGPAAAWDLNLRASEKAAGIRRITQVLGHRSADSLLDRPAPTEPAASLYRDAIARHWSRQGIAARIETQADGTQRSTWDIVDPPLVSIIIPNKNKPDLLKVCIHGILRDTDYPKIEIIIVDNLSTDPVLEAFYSELESQGLATIVRYNQRFNYSAACNAGAQVAKGDLLLFLNNDIEMANPDWLAELVRFAKRPGVGVVGTMLVYPNGVLQHAGVVAGLHICGLIFRETPLDHWGVFASPSIPRNYLAIMGACQMIRREVFERIGGFDETYRISNGDVALCVRAWRAGYRTAYTPFARLIHHEGATRGHSNPHEDLQRTVQDLSACGIVEDPFIHPGLSLASGPPSVRVGRELSGRDLLREYTARFLSGFPQPSKLDLFNDADVAEACGLERDQFLWSPEPAEAVNDLWSAARYVIDLLRMRPDFRRRFPKALSEGKDGAFAEWLASEEAKSFGLSPEACGFIGQALGCGLSDRARQVYLLSDELRGAFPLALTPVGRRGLFRWLMNDGRKLPVLRLETVWWFFLECAENPAAELVRTYQFTPEWQRIFADGLTIFGRERLADWLSRFYGIDETWVDPQAWPETGSPAQHLRLAYALREHWQRRHPGAFEDVERTRRFLDWLATADAGLTEKERAWCASVDRGAFTSELVAGGVNVLGHFCYPSGLRTSVESLTEGLVRNGLSVTLRDIWADNVGDDPHHGDFHGSEVFETTIIHTQPEPFFEVSYPRSGLYPRDPRTYRIGYWYWELDSIPESWLQQAAQVDELWAATRFVADAMKARFDLPVQHMMPGVELPAFNPHPRAYFGLPEGKFTFLFVFHMMSIMERKNPLGLIKAYRKAFGDDPQVSLVLKTSFGEKHPKLMAEMRDAAAGEGITIIDAIYTQEETLSLMQAADCYVSLHRSEGYGLTMAEAMLLGKPVIATGYSGNVDFMDADNSLLVDYDLATLERDYPPYAAGSRWAEPSVDHAARLMRQVFENQAWAAELGQKARLDLGERMSIEASGRRMAARLAEIRSSRSVKQDRGQPQGIPTSD